MEAPRNTLEGYEVDGADLIPDDEDTGIGFGAGERVRIDDDHDTYPGELGVVQAVARGRGIYQGSLVVDVLVDDTSDAHRFLPGEVEVAE